MMTVKRQVRTTVGGLRKSLLDSGLIRRVSERFFGVEKSKKENELQANAASKPFMERSRSARVQFRFWTGGLDQYSFF
jgi:hypothetical protein